MTLVTVFIGLALAYLQRDRCAAWVRTHLDYQIITFWWGIVGLCLSVALWQVIGWMQWSAALAWSFGYLVLILYFAWIVSRCAVGLHRLMGNQGMPSRTGIR